MLGARRRAGGVGCGDVGVFEPLKRPGRELVVAAGLGCGESPAETGERQAVIADGSDAASSAG